MKQRNIKSGLDHLSTLEIKQLNKEKSFPLAVTMMQIQGDFNFATVIRSCVAFGVREVFYYGPRKAYDRRGTVGCHHYIDVNFIPLGDFDKFSKLKKQYPNFIAMDIVEGVSEPVEKHKWEAGTMLFFGEERHGLPLEVMGFCDKVLHMTQPGSCRSLNVGVAAGIAIHDFVTRFEK